MNLEPSGPGAVAASAAVLPAPFSSEKTALPPGIVDLVACSGQTTPNIQGVGIPFVARYNFSLGSSYWNKYHLWRPNMSNYNVFSSSNYDTALSSRCSLEMTYFAGSTHTVVVQHIYTKARY